MNHTVRPADADAFGCETDARQAVFALRKAIATKAMEQRGVGRLRGVWQAPVRPAEIYEALDGQGFDTVYTRSSRMSRQEIEGLLHFGNAWAAENGVVRTKSRRQLREEKGISA